ncbi:MAG: chloramphenicol-sensitive protein RarD [Pseudohongiellaceae bacterium]|jgi:chloramphenicol-sensitive protein RarD
MTRPQQGSLLAVSAFIIWGLFPLYFKLVSHIAALEILSNRIVWAAVCLFFLLFILKRWPDVLAIIRNPQQIMYLVISTVLIVTNWGVYIWAVNSNNIIEASLGYYINPLFNIVLGYLLLKEKLRSLQWFAVFLATVGVAIQLITYGEVPWIALTLAVSFGLYGFVHKKVNVGSVPSLFIETIILLPVAFILLSLLASNNTGPVLWTLSDWLLLMIAGPVTIIPLLLFTGAAKRLNYSTLGFLQYIAPSILFVLALFLYDEPFSVAKLITFILIWSALLLLTVDMFKHQRLKRLYKKQQAAHVNSGR